MIDNMVNELLDAILEAIYPAEIRREWIAKVIRPIVTKYLRRNSEL